MALFVGINLCKIIFGFLVRRGVLLAIFSKRVFRVWCGMEIRFFGVMPLLIGKGWCEAESSFKYFMVQVIGSSFMLTAVLGLMGRVYVGHFLMFFLIVGLFLKLGVFPFHAWFPRVIGGCSWSSCFLLLVVQKISPYWLISGIGMPICVSMIFVFSGAFTRVVGSLGGLNQVRIRGVLGYSSLSHRGWLMALCCFDFYYFCVYFALYAFIVFFILGMMFCFSRPLVLRLYFLSLGGLPPFLGRVGKFLGVKALVGVRSFLASLLVLRSIIRLGYYV